VDTWQPNNAFYPDAEEVLISAVHDLNLADDVAAKLPHHHTTAITINRVGGRDPTAVVQIRCYAPTDHEATTLARHLAARLPALVRTRPELVRVWQNTGPTDLGSDPHPMRQMIYEITLQPQQL